jgi:hypothetical protein
MRAVAAGQRHTAEDVGAFLAEYVLLKDFFYRDFEEVEAQMTGSSSCTLMHRFVHGVRHTRSGCRSFASFWRRALELAGARNVTLTQSLCVSDGANRCEFMFTW